MWVTVPVAPISRSPLTSETPTASPSRSGPDGPCASGEAAPVIIGLNPDARNAPAMRSAISGSNPPITSGVAIGRIIDPSCAPAAAGKPIA
jgi:hypothetical protein